MGEGNMAIKIKEFSAPAVINYAHAQSGLPIIQSICLLNDGDEICMQAELTVATSPAFCAPVSFRVDYLPAHGMYEIKNVELTPDMDFLARPAENRKGHFHVTIREGDDSSQEFFFAVELLAFDSWQGLRFYPELLGCYAIPDGPALSELLIEASALLGERTDNPSFDGYGTQNPERARQQALAIQEALQAGGIAGCLLPQDYEVIGQAMKDAETLWSTRAGSPLELSLCHAACLETAGLHPLLIVGREQIFVGVWLEDRCFPEPVQDLSRLAPYLSEGSGKIVVTQWQLMPGKAGAEGRYAAREVANSGEEAFGDSLSYVIDIAGARRAGYQPLPQRVFTQDGCVLSRPAPLLPEARSFGPDSKNTDAKERMEAASAPLSGPAAKKLYWERKLLDIGLRNPLINLRFSKTIIPLLLPSPAELEDALTQGHDFTIRPRPEETEALGEKPDPETLCDFPAASQAIRSEYARRHLCSAYGEKELNAVVKNVYRAAKTSAEETGANTLYLALGMLRWYETKASVKPRYAPIILIPVEMVRRSLAQGYVVRIRDDEPQINMTLLEKLRQDYDIRISGLETLPADEHGIDIKKIFSVLQGAVNGRQRWGVLETACIGIFSFTRFVMWNDIKNRSEELEKNKIVRSLLEGRLCFEAAAMAIGERVSEENVFLPMAADASQLFAIRKAAEGESFVLHGPPGTGKSQTITTMIANALAQGKTVLFAAEKMAALEVVQRRLEKIGIGAFCLELHSNKSRKRDVLDQLRRACEVGQSQPSEEYGRRAEQLAAMRRELDEYTDQLHGKTLSGLSVYELIQRYEENADAPELETLSAELTGALTPERLEELLALTRQLQHAADDAGHPHGHRLRAVGGTEYSQQLRLQLPGLLAACREALGIVRAELESCRASYEGLALSGLSYRRLKDFYATLSQVSLWRELPQEWLRENDPRGYAEQVRRMADCGVQCETLKAQLLADFKETILAVDADLMLSELGAAKGKWLLAKSLETGKIHKQLSLHAKGTLPKDSMEATLTLLSEYRRKRAETDKYLNYCGRNLPPMEELSQWETLREQATRAKDSLGELSAVRAGRQLLADLLDDPFACDALRELLAHWQSAETALARLDRFLGIKLDEQEARFLDSRLTLCDVIEKNVALLREWMNWNRAAKQACEAGLSGAVDACLDGMPTDLLLPAVSKALYAGLAMAAIDASAVLSRFSGATFNEKIEAFRKMDDKMMKLTQEEIFCRLAARVPDFSREAAKNSEISVLQRAIRSGGRGKSIRQLLAQLPRLLPRLCPCMLMSPISAAQYLEPGREPFDLVVFDEASQLPTCNAVGVLARGRNAVIVGDPKQMPPTSFFAAGTSEEEFFDEEDMESILDDCLTLSMPQTHLLWHYRSRHESLIAFSNRRFYENKLNTFPSVNDRVSKVRLIPVDGVFERGKSRQNPAEAKAIVEELIRRCHDPEQAACSVGIVTFNVNQQNLIDDLLTEACRKDPALEAWISAGQEPCFIKNLENVQGDERDVILFSVGFGPDETGKIYMNFGPLNRDGGWRRLNVAVTRARREMLVFSTLRSDMLDLSRTSAEGVSALKDFLAYAEGRPLAENAACAGPGQSDSGGIAASICRMLAGFGYDTTRNIGHSACRVDIGVTDPERPERYLLGILLDGPGYGSAKTTRDREISQSGVLSGLGWELYRVWTMDWWDNKERVIAGILERLRERKEEKIS